TVEGRGHEVLDGLRGRDVPDRLEAEHPGELLQDLRALGIADGKKKIRPHAGLDGQERQAEDASVPAREVGEVEGVRHTAVVLDVFRRSTDVLGGDDDGPRLDRAPERVACAEHLRTLEPRPSIEAVPGARNGDT